MRITQSILYCMSFVNIIVRCTGKMDFVYHKYDELEDILQNFSSTNHSRLKVRTYAIGKTVEERKLLVLEITAARNISRIPNIKLIGGLFGTQPVGMEILLHFIEYLIESYERDKYVTYLLDTTKVHILPCMNPDGTVANIKGNSNKVPLYKTFPDYFVENKIPKQPESQAIIHWMENTYFVLSASLNDLSEVVVYPFNAKRNYGTQSEPSLTPDNDVFVYLSKTYSFNHATRMKTNYSKSCTRSYKDGIVNGALFRSQDGTMQDYNYFKHGCMELSIGLTCDAKPQEIYLEDFWKDNKNALVQYCLKANQGVYGTVRDYFSNKPVEASFRIVGRDMVFHTNKNGEFWKVLLNGTYTVEVSAEGYYKENKTFEIVSLDDLPKLKHVNILLTNRSVPTTTIFIPAETKSTIEDFQIDARTEVHGPVLGTVLSKGTTHHNVILLYIGVILTCNVMK